MFSERPDRKNQTLSRRIGPPSVASWVLCRLSRRDVLSNGLIEKSIHDVKRAVGLLDRFNITLEGVKDDTYLAAYLLDPSRSGRNASVPSPRNRCQAVR